MSRSRDISKFLGSTENGNASNLALLHTGSSTGLDSAQVTTIASATALTVYDSIGALPTTSLSAGDQGYVTSNNRLYLSNGSGWYNVALINATPTVTVSPSGTIELSTEGTATVVTLTATDSDNADANLTLSVDSGGDFFKMATVSQDSSVFTITPRSKDSATALGFDGTSSLTFKASDGLNFGAATNTFTLGFSIEGSQRTSLLIKADTAGTDNQVDASTNNHAITETGTVKSTAFTPYHPGGYSTKFAAAADRIITNLATSGTAAWTVEWWVYHTANSGTSSQNRNFGAATNDMMFLNTNLTTPTLYIGGQARVSGSKTMAIGQWYHMALVRSTSSNTIKLYIDGVLEGTSSVQAGATYNVPAKTDFGVGTDQNFTAYGMTGYIRDFRYVIGTEVYTSAFTPPEEPLTAISGTDLLLCNHAAVIDTSGNYNVVTVSSTSTARFGPYVHAKSYTKAVYGGSVRFGGSSNLNTAAVTWDNTKDWTFEGWWYGTNASSGTFATLNSGGGVDGLYVMHVGGVYINGIEWGIPGSPANYFRVNHWNHWALVRHSGTYKFYVNGISMWSETNAGNSGSSSPRFGIGATATNAAAVQDGTFISDVRFTEDGVYTADFIPPTAPLTVLGDTIFKTCTNTQSIWDAQGGHALTPTGNAAASNTQRKFTTSSAIAFDGSGDYVAWDQRDATGLSGNATIEMWVYPNSNSNYQTLFSMNRGTSTGFNFGIDGSSRPFLWKGAFRIQTGTVSNTTWSHVALVRNSGVWSIYVNGTAVGATWADTTTYTGTDFAIGDTVASAGGATGEWFNGYIQDVRYSKGFARYTDTFTPPTSEHSA